jgi:DNA-directed RNA polymerase specialized sigma24 family protein
MDTRTGEEPPKSTDLIGWQRAIAGNGLKNFRLEALVAAFQDLGHLDSEVQHALTKHLSDSVLHLLRKEVGFNHPNQGWDIIFRTHDVIFKALVRPDSADGRGLRVAFGPRVRFRLKDAIAKERRERRTPEDIEKSKKIRKAGPDVQAPEDAIDLDASAELPEGDAKASEDSDRDDGKGQASDLDNGLADLDEQIDVERILNCVSDERKRLAFHLFMNGAPYKTKKEHVESIAEALNISERTAREWVKEVRLFLAENDGVKHLMRLKVGEKS